jgi:hypothetical protein
MINHTMLVAFADPISDSQAEHPYRVAWVNHEALV